MTMVMIWFNAVCCDGLMDLASATLASAADSSCQGKLGQRYSIVNRLRGFWAIFSGGAGADGGINGGDILVWVWHDFNKHVKPTGLPKI